MKTQLNFVLRRLILAIDTHGLSTRDKAHVYSASRYHQYAPLLADHCSFFSARCSRCLFYMDAHAFLMCLCISLAVPPMLCFLCGGLARMPFAFAQGLHLECDAPPVFADLFARTRGSKENWRSLAHKHCTGTR